jgi:hypothetical protein
VRLGGVYSLERISKESPDDYWTAMENRERTAEPLEKRELLGGDILRQQPVATPSAPAEPALEPNALTA